MPIIFIIGAMMVNAFRSAGDATQNETALTEEMSSTANLTKYKIALQKNSYAPTTAVF